MLVFWLTWISRDIHLANFTTDFFKAWSIFFIAGRSTFRVMTVLRSLTSNQPYCPKYHRKASWSVELQTKLKSMTGESISSVAKPRSANIPLPWQLRTITLLLCFSSMKYPKMRRQEIGCLAAKILIIHLHCSCSWALCALTKLTYSDFRLSF